MQKSGHYVIITSRHPKMNQDSPMGKVCSLLMLLAMLAIPASAYADTNTTGPKPLTAAPPLTTDSSNQPKTAPNALPQILIDARQKTRDDFKALMVENRDMQQKCTNAHTPAERYEWCERRPKIWQSKLDALNDRISNVHLKIQAWRRQQAGLPPLPTPFSISHTAA